MTDTSTGERLLARLVVASWGDEDAEWRHFLARRRLANEFFRRKAEWAKALGVTEQWPFADIALAFDPSVKTDPTWVERLEAESGYELNNPLVRRVVVDMFRWVSLGQAPYERFPEFDDPYEPMVQVFELGGEFGNSSTGIELPVGPVVFRSLDFRLAQAPLAIDAGTLAELDEKDRVRQEESRARGAAQRAEDD
jgi:hypothetical protein